MIESDEFCHWLQGYLDGGATDGIEPIREKLKQVLDDRLVVRLLAKGAVIDNRKDQSSITERMARRFRRLQGQRST